MNAKFRMKRPVDTEGTTQMAKGPLQPRHSLSRRIRLPTTGSPGDVSRLVLLVSTQLCVTFLVCALVGTSVSAQTIASAWEGLRAPTGFGPPDVHGAPGPDGVIATVNLQIEYFSKSGDTIWGPTSLPTFFVGNTGFLSQNSDPKVVFDAGARRFFVIMQENHNSRFWLNLAVSRNADPRTSTSADWLFYRLDATEYASSNSAGGTNYGGDYPGLAVDGQALYVTYRMYAFDTNGLMSGYKGDYTNTALLIMNKNQLLSGTGNLNSLYLPGSGLQPVTPFGANPGNVMYGVDYWNENVGSVRIVAVTDPLGSRTVSTQFLSVAPRGASPPPAPQLDTTNLIPPINRTLNNASLVHGDVWFCGTVGPANGPAMASYIRLRLNGWPSSGSVSVVEDGTVGSTNYWNFCPAIGVNVAGEAVMTWTRSSSSTYPTMMYAYRDAGDTSFASAQVVKASTSFSSSDRWGDYATVWPDPDDGSLWMANEWIRIDTGNWSTWWAQVLTPTKDFYVDWNPPNPSIQDGSLTYPYTTVQAAHLNITHGVIHIFGDHTYNELFTINKAVQLQLYSGSSVTVGQP